MPIPFHRCALCAVALLAVPTQRLPAAPASLPDAPSLNVAASYTARAVTGALTAAVTGFPVLRFYEEAPTPAEPQAHIIINGESASLSVLCDDTPHYSDGSPCYSYALAAVRARYTYHYQCPSPFHSYHNGDQSDLMQFNRYPTHGEGNKFGGAASFKNRCCDNETGSLTVEFDVIAFQNPPPDNDGTWSPADVYFTDRDTGTMSLLPRGAHDNIHDGTSWGVGIWVIP
jgi:hypothetical protein